MSVLEAPIIAELADRLSLFLQSLGSYHEATFLDAGGSAAVFRVESEYGPRALKVFNPSFLNGPSGDAERQRLEVQRRLINHSCPSLIQTFRVEEAQGTAFIEMEFLPWLQLSKHLSLVPDEAIAPLIMQLVDAVRFLEEQNIVHRDIKPENILISSDFKQLKLLDLGVAREIQVHNSDASVTDHGNQRPFLATAQYSSPEYLFRLDEPTLKLWSGLNLYQIGAVLHDLIMKKAIFEDEMKLGNRWLVARAVLTKTPSFVDATPGRLFQFKALATKCLVKDLETRLRLVSWADFNFEEAKDPIAVLRGRLAKGHKNFCDHTGSTISSRVEFDRAEFAKRFADQIRSELIPICGTQLPITAKPSADGKLPEFTLLFAFDNQITISCIVKIEWLRQIYERTANISLSAQIVCCDAMASTPPSVNELLCTATIFEGEFESVIIVRDAIASVAAIALDLIESAEDRSSLHGIDLGALKQDEQE